MNEFPDGGLSTKSITVKPNNTNPLPYLHWGCDPAATPAGHPVAPKGYIVVTIQCP